MYQIKGGLFFIIPLRETQNKDLSRVFHAETGKRNAHAESAVRFCQGLCTDSLHETSPRSPPLRELCVKPQNKDLPREFHAETGKKIHTRRAQ